MFSSYLCLFSVYLCVYPFTHTPRLGNTVTVVPDFSMKILRYHERTCKSNICDQLLLRDREINVCLCKRGVRELIIFACSVHTSGARVACADRPRMSCIPCLCNAAGTADAGVCSSSSGQCNCRSGTTGRDCGQCKDGFYGLSAGQVLGCLTCGCNVQGTINGSTSCDVLTGQCPCQTSNIGRVCSQCAVGYYQLPLASLGVCATCDPQCSDLGCFAAGSSTAACKGCRNVQDNGVCVAACPANKYADSIGVCQACDSQCAGGCSGVKANEFRLRYIYVCGACVHDFI